MGRWESEWDMLGRATTLAEDEEESAEDEEVESLEDFLVVVAAMGMMD